MLAAEGLDVGRLLARPPSIPRHWTRRARACRPSKISRLWELAVEQSGNPALGLAQHEVARPASFDVVGYAMMSCADLRSAFERLIRYMLILSDALPCASQGAGGYRITFELLGGSMPIPRPRIEFIVVTLVGFCRWISGRAVQPLAMGLPYPPPADLAPYRATFRCPVSFDAARHQPAVRRLRRDGTAADIQS